MAIVQRITRVVNGRKHRRKSLTSKLSATKKRHSRRRPRTATNPGLIVTLGSLAGNPSRKGKTTMRKARRKKASSRRRRNPSYGLKARGMRKVRRYGKVRRSRNPNLFGSTVSTVSMAKAVVGGLVGVTATKTIVAMLPPNITASPIFRVLASAGIAWGAGKLGNMVDSAFGSAVQFGGFMQAGSLALNAFLPGIGSRFALAGVPGGGMGAIMPVNYPTVPYNPVRDSYFQPRVALPGPAVAGMASVLPRV